MKDTNTFFRNEAEPEKVINLSLYSRKQSEELGYFMVTLIGVSFCIVSFYIFIQLKVVNMINQQIGLSSISESMTQIVMHTNTQSLIFFDMLMIYRRRVLDPSSTDYTTYSNRIKGTILEDIPDVYNKLLLYHYHHFYQDYILFHGGLVSNTDFGKLDITQNILTRSILIKDENYLTGNRSEQSSPNSISTMNSFISAININTITTRQISNISATLDTLIETRKTQPTVQPEIDSLFKELEQKLSLYLVNTLERTLPTMLDVYEYMRTVISVKAKAAYNSEFYIFIAVYLAVVLGNFIWTLISRIIINREKYSIVETYAFLTFSELEYMSHGVGNKLKFFDGILKDEDHIEDADIMGKYSTGPNKKTGGEISQAKLGSSKVKAMNQRSRMMLRDKTNKSFSVSLIINLVSTSIFCGIAIVSFLLSSRVERLYDLRNLFYQQGQKMYGVGQYFIHSYLSITFGDYIRMDGHLVSEDDRFNRESIKNFTDYWLSQTKEHHDLLGDKHNELIGFLNGKGCELIGQAESDYDIVYTVCERSIKDIYSKGIIYYLVFSVEYISSIMKDMRSMYPSIYEQTKTERIILDDRLWFDSTFMDIRIAVIETIASFMEFVSSATLEELNGFEKETTSIIQTLNLWSVLIITLLSIVLSCVWASCSSYDKNTCYETFSIINPEIIAKNNYINNRFTTYFRYE